MPIEALLNCQQSLWPVTAKDWAEFFAYVVTILAAVIAVPRYWLNSARERTRWLHELYDRLYGNPELREVRIRIDDGETEFVRTEADSNLMGKLDEYLNFFEFVGFLETRGELKAKEVREMFEYPLDKIGQDANLRAHLEKKEYGYERLPNLLTKMGYWKK